MLITDPYPYLSHLLGAYFHQDAFFDGQSDDEIIGEFASTAQPYEVLGTRADILRFLHHHGSNELVASVERIFAPGVSLGTSDAQVSAWLMHVYDLLTHSVPGDAAQ